MYTDFNEFLVVLDKLPKVFCLENMKKDYFSHLFNKRKHNNYVGSLPVLEYYNPDNIEGQRSFN